MAVRSKYYKSRALKTIVALKDNGFSAFYAPTKQEAVSIALNLVPKNATVEPSSSFAYLPR
jgi:L-lactate utilization protein LutB